MSRAKRSQSPELILETWAPNSISAVTLCPSITGASLDHPTRQAIGPGFKNRMAGAVSLGSVCLAAFILSGLCSMLGWECMGPTAGWSGLCWQGLGHIPLVPPDWFKADAGVGHSLAMWPHPWHLKHWREFGSHLLAMPSLLVTWLLWLLLPVPWLPVPCPICKCNGVDIFTNKHINLYYLCLIPFIIKSYGTKVISTP